jgi:hypothetical protein
VQQPARERPQLAAAGEVARRHTHHDALAGAPMKAAAARILAQSYILDLSRQVFFF